MRGGRSFCGRELSLRALLGRSWVADRVQPVHTRLPLSLLEHDLPRDEVRPWIFVVATNLARDRVRKRERRRRLLVANQEPRITSGSPHEDLERAERVAAVRRALERLSERDRQMLLMREEGFRYSEIAEAVGVRSTSVGALVARALKRFSAAYGAVGETNAAPE